MKGLMYTAENIRAMMRKENPKTRTSRCQGLDKINENPGEWVWGLDFELKLKEAQG